MQCVLAAGLKGLGAVRPLRILSAVCSTKDIMSASKHEHMVNVCGVAAGFVVASSQGMSVKYPEVVTARSMTGHGMEANATAVVVKFDQQVPRRVFVAGLAGCAQITCCVPSPSRQQLVKSVNFQRCKRLQSYSRHI